MQLKIVRQADATNRPASRNRSTFMLGGETYEVADLSPTGLTLAGVPAAAAPAKEFNGKLHMPGDDTDVLLQVDAETQSYDPDSQMLSARFSEASRRRVAEFGGPLGLIPATSPVLPPLGAAAAFSTQTVAVPNPLGADKAVEDGGGFTWQRLAGLSLLGLFGVLTVAWVGSAVYEERFVVRAASAVVDAPVTRIRAPVSGYYQSAVKEGEEMVAAGRPLGFIRTATGGVTPIDSPCDCYVLDERKTRGQYVLTGEQLMVLSQADQRIDVTGYVPLSKMDDLRLGTHAEIKFPTLSAPVPGVVADIRAERTTFAGGASTEPFARVTVRPARELSQAELGLPVSLSFDTFGNSRIAAMLPDALRETVFGPQQAVADAGTRSAVAPEMLNDPDPTVPAPEGVPVVESALGGSAVEAPAMPAAGQAPVPAKR